MVNPTTSRKDSDGSSHYRNTAGTRFYPEALTSSSVNNRSAPVFDDLIAALANAHENQRARQVMEWESMRPSSFQLSV